MFNLLTSEVMVFQCFSGHNTFSGAPLLRNTKPFSGHHDTPRMPMTCVIRWKCQGSSAWVGWNPYQFTAVSVWKEDEFRIILVHFQKSWVPFTLSHCKQVALTFSSTLLKAFCRSSAILLVFSFCSLSTVSRIVEVQHKGWHKNTYLTYRTNDFSTMPTNMW